MVGHLDEGVAVGVLVVEALVPETDARRDLVGNRPFVFNVESLVDGFEPAVVFINAAPDQRVYALRHDAAIIQDNARSDGEVTEIFTA